MTAITKINFNQLSILVYSKKYLKYDIVAAIVLFLVAIPLCLGIALASGVPLISGIISGIIGGIVIGAISNSQVSVSGPAAGMAAVMIMAIAELGDFNTFLLAVVLAGILQTSIGIMRVGFAADYIPSNVVQGLLCAIGILLICKQLPLAFINILGSNQSPVLWQELSKDSLSNFLLFHLNFGAATISSIGLALFVYLNSTKKKWLKNRIPTPIVVVITGVIINEFFLLANSFLAQKSPYVVNIPNLDLTWQSLAQLEHPNWAAFTNGAVYFYALSIALVASIESLLNIKAGEKLDKHRRYCSKDRELIAQGIGNLSAGLIGGIPITSVIARTSVNIQAGCKTKFSTILHGILLVFAVFIFSTWLNRIPLATLAIVLIYTGYKLTTPEIYVDIYRQGMDRFLPFIVTVVGIICLNLLSGILLGLAVSLFYILKNNSQARLDIIKEHYPTGITHRLILPQQISFLNKASLIVELNSIPKNAQFIIDARYANYIDKEIIELIKEFKNEQAPLKNISLNLIGFKNQYDIHNYIDFINVTTYSVQATLQPFQVLNILKEGNLRFLRDTRIHRSAKFDIKHTACTQHPLAIVLGCIDSRVPVETIFDMSFGDLFTVRIAGNVINTDVLASIEYACNVVGAKLIVVLGHTKCGAIQAACSGSTLGHIGSLLAKIKPAITAETTTAKEHRHGDNQQFTDRVMKLNIINSLLSIYNKSKILKAKIEQDNLAVIGAIYNVASGVVNFNDYTGVESCINNKIYHELDTKMKTLLMAANNSDTTL